MQGEENSSCPRPRRQLATGRRGSKISSAQKQNLGAELEEEHLHNIAADNKSPLSAFAACFASSAAAADRRVLSGGCPRPQLPQTAAAAARCSGRRRRPRLRTGGRVGRRHRPRWSLALQLS